LDAAATGWAFRPTGSIVPVWRRQGGSRRFRVAWPNQHRIGANAAFQSRQGFGDVCGRNVAPPPEASLQAARACIRRVGQGKRFPAVVLLSIGGGAKLRPRRSQSGGFFLHLPVRLDMLRGFMRSKTLKIAALAGDGIGPEVMREAIKVLRAAEKKFGLTLQILEAPVGWAGIDAAGTALPDETLALCKKADAILFGSVGLPDRDPTLAKEKRPERAALLRLRKEFGLFANLRPVKLPKELAGICPLRPERQGEGIDILIVRELTAGLYFGPKSTEEIVELHEHPRQSRRYRKAVDTMVITSGEIERIAHVAFQAAQQRRKKVTSIDKANVLENGVLWREVVTDIGKKYPDVALDHMFVDNAAMQLVLRPGQFDVMLCENTFGDILSDEAAALGGSLGLLPSASLGKTHEQTTFGLYEPAGGTAPDIAGKDLANPIAQILSAALMFRHSFGLPDAATAIETAVAKTIAAGYRTGDIHQSGDAKTRKVGTREMGDAIASAI
jgi:3-isopropylmalate dehydrogenase